MPQIYYINIYELARISGSFTVDSTAIQQTLSWTPPYMIDQGLTETAGWYRDISGKG